MSEKNYCDKCKPQAPAQEPVNARLREALSKALRRAYNLGQRYWQQADSEYASQHRKADETAAAFQTLHDETINALAAADAQAEGLTDEQIDEEWFEIHALPINNVAKARLLARAIERAHGITATGAKGK